MFSVSLIFTLGIVVVPFLCSYLLTDFITLIVFVVIYMLCVGRVLLKENLLTDYQCTQSVRTIKFSGRSVLYPTCIFHM